MPDTDPVTEARALLAKATPGEWHSDGPWWDDHGNSLPMVTAGEERRAVVVAPHVSENPDNDLNLIAAAPRLLAALVAEVERLREADMAHQSPGGSYDLGVQHASDAAAKEVLMLRTQLKECTAAASQMSGRLDASDFVSCEMCPTEAGDLIESDDPEINGLPAAGFWVCGQCWNRAMGGSAISTGSGS